MGIAMHHDAITGTSPDNTIRDYEMRFQKAMEMNRLSYRDSMV